MQELLQKHALNLLAGGHAHATLEQILAAVPKTLRNAATPHLPYTLWELLEHMRLAQKDIYEYMTDPNYKMGNFPEDYWPEKGSRMEWDKTVQAFEKEREMVRSLVKKQDDLLKQLPYGKKGHTYLREILILAEHASYHLGEMVAILRFHGAWK